MKMLALVLALHPCWMGPHNARSLAFQRNVQGTYDRTLWFRTLPPEVRFRVLRVLHAIDRHRCLQ